MTDSIGGALEHPLIANGTPPSDDPERAEDEAEATRIRPEIVFGLVGALGTDLAQVERALSSALLSVHYSAQPVRVSELISQKYQDLGLNQEDEPATALDLLMDQGDQLRQELGHGGAAAILAIAEISALRYEHYRESFGTEDVAVDDLPTERPEHASIVRQLKHPDEVRQLRSVYGSRFVLIGAWSHQSERETAVRERLESAHPAMDEHDITKHASRLMRRDQKDGKRKMGQRVRDTFELADAYVALRPGKSIEDEMRRIVRLLFGAPFDTPTFIEQAMFQAAGARLRSAAGGRQVGAVIVDQDGELVVTGTNDVPKAGGGQYWTDDERDYRDFQLGYDYNDRQQVQIVTDIVKRLQATDPSWLSPERATADPAELAREAVTEDGPLVDSRVGDLLEFGRIMHAEMAAICTAARRGVALRGLTMLTTTYPCHECARLIIGAGITRLVYIDPYPKSKVPQMYRHEVGEGELEDDKRVQFEPFAGIAPRLYASVFSMSGRSRDEFTGAFVEWVPETAMPRLVDESSVQYSIQVLEDHVLLSEEDELLEG